MARRRTVGTKLLVAVMVLTALSGCQTARVGARCRGTGFAQNANNILQCKNGRWRVLMTKAQYLQLVAAIRNASTTTTTTTTTAPVTTTTTTTPLPPPAYGFGAGYEHTCAVIANTVKCIGRNHYGQLGNATTVDGPTAWVSTGITNGTSVSNGSSTSCALRQDRTIWCWGFGGGGSLGNGSTTDSSTPVQVSGISTATRVSVGANGACAVLADRTVRCWGHRFITGDGTGSASLSPVTATIGEVNAISVGGLHVCAQKTDGTVWCWGKNDHGQLGDGSTTDSYTPVQVAGVSGASGVAAGGFSGTSCAVLGTGGVSCWGADAHSQLGDGDASTADRLTANPVAGLSDARQVDLAFYSACAMRSSGAVSCWGVGGYLGTGSASSSDTPIAVTGISDAAAIDANGLVTCALLRNNAGRCWGANTYGQLAGGTTSSTLSPVTVIGMP